MELIPLEESSLLNVPVDEQLGRGRRGAGINGMLQSQRIEPKIYIVHDNPKVKMTMVPRECARKLFLSSENSSSKNLYSSEI